MRFLIHPPSVLDECPDIFRAYISGWDGRVFPTRVEIDGNLMACRRPVAESGSLHVAWPVEGFGQPVLATPSLPEREEPYLLAVELARGQISQLRELYSERRTQGNAIPGRFPDLYQAAHRQFAKAVSAQDDVRRAAEFARQALQASCEAGELLTELYANQQVALFRQRSGQPPVLLGCRLNQSVPSPQEATRFCEAFSAAVVPVEWRLIEPAEGEYNWELNDKQVAWCDDRKLHAIGGPLIDLSPNGLPAWLWQWEDDVLNLQSFLCDFVETAISRYCGRIRHWEVAARANSGGALTLGEEDRLSIVARVLEVARQVDEEIQLMIAVDQPWGEYQARGHHRLSPFQFADALLRSGVGLSALNLEFGVGYQPRGTAPRDRMALSRLIDRWAALGIPLYVTLAVPSAVADEFEHFEGDLEVPAVATWKARWSDDAQARWLEENVPLLMAKEPVVGIVWSHFSDAGVHRYPTAGLLREDGSPKPALERLKTIANAGRDA
ncbi:MAG: endo-1,4-beta-xylanase [Planctomycetaceae bacterium]